MPLLSSLARRFSSVRSQFSLPALLPPPERSHQRELLRVRVVRALADEPLVVAVVVAAAVPVVLAAVVDLYVATPPLK